MAGNFQVVLLFLLGVSSILFSQAHAFPSESSGEEDGTNLQLSSIRKQKFYCDSKQESEYSLKLRDLEECQLNLQYFKMAWPQLERQRTSCLSNITIDYDILLKFEDLIIHNNFPCKDGEECQSIKEENARLKAVNRHYESVIVALLNLFMNYGSYSHLKAFKLFFELVLRHIARDVNKVDVLLDSYESVSKGRRNPQPQLLESIAGMFGFGAPGHSGESDKPNALKHKPKVFPKVNSEDTTQEEDDFLEINELPNTSLILHKSKDAQKNTGMFDAFKNAMENQTKPKHQEKDSGESLSDALYDILKPKKQEKKVLDSSRDMEFSEKASLSSEFLESESEGSENVSPWLRRAKSFMDNAKSKILAKPKHASNSELSTDFEGQIDRQDFNALKDLPIIHEYEQAAVKKNSHNSAQKSDDMETNDFEEYQKFRKFMQIQKMKKDSKHTEEETVKPFHGALTVNTDNSETASDMETDEEASTVIEQNSKAEDENAKQRIVATVQTLISNTNSDSKNSNNDLEIDKLYEAISEFQGHEAKEMLFIEELVTNIAHMTSAISRKLLGIQEKIKFLMSNCNGSSDGSLIKGLIDASEELINKTKTL
eukprot:Nk52_evm9s301 gene=Nk52_evmTU9s301